MEFVSDWEFVLGVPMFSKMRRPGRYFSEEEDEIIRTQYKNTPTNELARQLGRDEKAVNRRAAVLGVKKSKELVRQMRQIAMKKGLKAIHGNKQKAKETVQA